MFTKNKFVVIILKLQQFYLNRLRIYSIIMQLDTCLRVVQQVATAYLPLTLQSSTLIPLHSLHSFHSIRYTHPIASTSYPILVYSPESLPMAYISVLFTIIITLCINVHLFILLFFVFVHMRQHCSLPALRLLVCLQLYCFLSSIFLSSPYALRSYALTTSLLAESYLLVLFSIYYYAVHYILLNTYNLVI